MRRLGLLILALPALLVMGESACRRHRPPRPRVSNPLIDSSGLFGDTTYIATHSDKASGFELFMKMLANDTQPRESGPALPDSGRAGARPESAGRQAKLTSEQPGGPADAGLLTLVGTIRRVKLEGGFWGFEAEDGNRYDPLNLPAELQKDGQRVKLWVRPQNGVASTHMWGKPIQIVRFARPR